MASVSDARAITLQKAQENIFKYQQRIKLLEETDLCSLTDDKIREFVNEVQTWYPIYAVYGNHITSSLWNWITSIVRGNNIENIAEFGQKEAAKDMKKFKAFLIADFQREINQIRDIFIKIDQDLIDSTIKDKRFL